MLEMFDRFGANGVKMLLDNVEQFLAEEAAKDTTLHDKLMASVVTHPPGPGEWMERVSRQTGEVTREWVPA